MFLCMLYTERYVPLYVVRGTVCSHVQLYYITYIPAQSLVPLATGMRCGTVQRSAAQYGTVQRSAAQCSMQYLHLALQQPALW